MTRVLVCGGRHYGTVPPRTPPTNRVEATALAAKQAARLEAVLDAAVQRLGLSVVIQGGADGADRLAAEWAFERGLSVATFNADWDRYGKTAGPMRNAKMLAEGKPDVVIAFPGTFGTWDMVKKAQAAGVTVHRIDPDQWPKRERG